MANDVVHFAVNAEDVERARSFYERVFGWTFTPWGPPDFYLIETSPTGIRGALQKRRHPPAGEGSCGYECTIAVDDVEATAREVERHGGRVTLAPTHLEQVGTLIHFEDTEGNVVGAMQYVDGLLDRPS